MARSAKANAIVKRRKELRDTLFGIEEAAWEPERGFFQAPRTLPLLVRLMSSPKLRKGKADPGLVYIELLSRHWGEGVVEMAHEEDHAYAAGLRGTSAVKHWRERMRILTELGFIRVRADGFRKFAYVLIRPPALVVEELRQRKLVDEEWLSAYRARQVKTNEPTQEPLPAKKPAPSPAPTSPFDPDDDDLPF